MKRPSILKEFWPRALVFGLLPVALGLGGALYLRFNDYAWLTDAGPFWPYTLVAVSAGILFRIVYGPYEEITGAVVAWLILLATWFYAPLWFTAIKVPTTAALVANDGHVTLVRDAARSGESDLWLLTRRATTRIVLNVSGKFVSNGFEISYGYAPAYIRARSTGEDLAPRLAMAADPVLSTAASENRTAKIAFLASKAAQDGTLREICRAAVDSADACPIKLSMAPTQEAVALGGTWSSQYSEHEALEERHLPSLVHLLTQTDVSLAKRDLVFGLLFDLNPSAATLAQLAQKSQSLTDEQFDDVIKRLVACSGEDCGDAAVVAAGVNRLSGSQRAVLRSKIVDDAGLLAIITNAAALRFNDAEIARLALRLRPKLRSDPSLAVRALEIFGDRLPIEAQRDAASGILDAKASYALAALERLNFSPELRQVLLKKVLVDAVLDDFATVRLNKTKLIEMLTPQELRALVAVSVKRGESSDRWHAFSVDTLPVSAMTAGERHQIVNGLVFSSPKSALEYVSKNREFLDPNEVAEVTRDYSRTVARDFCLHLSHRNKNWKQNFFSEAQVQIFRDCADGK